MMKSSYIGITVLMVSSLIPNGDADCQSAKPLKGFKEDDMLGKFYLVAQKVAFPWQSKMACDATTITKNGKQWEFKGHAIETDGSIFDSSAVGTMTQPGQWSVTNSNDTKTKHTLTAIGGAPKSWYLISICDASNGKTAFWLFYHKKIAPQDLPDSLQIAVLQALQANNIDTEFAIPVNETNCNV